jgi:hypothetical protein
VSGPFNQVLGSRILTKSCQFGDFFVFLGLAREGEEKRPRVSGGPEAPMAGVNDVNLWWVA